MNRSVSTMVPSGVTISTGPWTRIGPSGMTRTVRQFLLSALCTNNHQSFCFYSGL